MTHFFRYPILLSIISILSASHGWAETLIVGTWNIQKGKYPHRIDQEMEKTALGMSDVIAFQEIKTENNTASELGQKFSYEVYHPTSDALISKFDFIDQGILEVNSDTGRHVTWATIDFRGVPVRLYSVHLSYKVKKNPFIPKVRGKEMDVILVHAETFEGPTIIAGDLNTLGYILFGQSKEPTIKKLKEAGYIDALQAHPSSTQLAGHFFPMGRIDWIWSKGFDVVDSVKGNYAGSDHRWMQATLKLKD